LTDHHDSHHPEPFGLCHPELVEGWHRGVRGRFSNCWCQAPLLDKEGNKGWWCKINYSKIPPRPSATPPETGRELKNYHASLRCVRISE